EVVRDVAALKAQFRADDPAVTLPAIAQPDAGIRAAQFQRIGTDAVDTNLIIAAEGITQRQTGVSASPVTNRLSLDHRGDHGFHHRGNKAACRRGQGRAEGQQGRERGGERGVHTNSAHVHISYAKRCQGVSRPKHPELSFSYASSRMAASGWLLRRSYTSQCAA